MAALLALWLGHSALATPAAADPSDLARQAARALNDATAALQDARSAEDRVAALTRTLSGFEDGLAALRTSLRTVTLRETALERQFTAQSEELARLLGMLMAVERTGGSQNGGPQILLHPAGPLGTARAGMMLADLTPAMAARVAELRNDLEELQALHAVQNTALAALQTGMETVQDARSDLGLALSERSDLPRRLTDDPVTLAVLLAGSDTLDTFARQLAATTVLGDVPAPAPFAQMRGTLPLPVRGTLLRGAGQPDAAGIARPGILIATAPGALVTTPVAATIRYAGPLLDYGNVIITEPDQGYLMILGGMEQAYGSAGDVLEAGAPLGFMPQPQPATGSAPGDTDTTAGMPLLQQGNRSETLYVELRSDGNTVDPADWFALSGE
ncbi:murein hydrolase activator EnvC family protein [Roseicitreum antarcticum]|uniref:Septal ring factor EnvC, activator of murein hydrolases AmiA and AmiB n=1 Tax=Roseicitreum antarcticum TaxID=564137 RepID=A0A1H2RL83_9RHOB|nr:peptidoglycan DD-metalloendopeptidase family protein [Roseicitreum antarcticum]SDW20243.1 Septal ring factor EnvC, activator of murein hydrolases AmiA and AmiB [Roseicitreum antarcticum]